MKLLLYSWKICDAGKLHHSSFVRDGAKVILITSHESGRPITTIVRNDSKQIMTYNRNFYRKKMIRLARIAQNTTASCSDAKAANFSTLIRDEPKLKSDLNGLGGKFETGVHT